MKAQRIIDRRVILSRESFAQLVVWSIPRSIPGSTHTFKYRLAYVVRGVCVLRYDNETGKGDHRHIGSIEEPYRFTGPERLLADFWHDVGRWDDENGVA